jgi:ribosome-binding factor A
MKSRRLLRVERQVKQIVGEILGRGTKDPRIGFVSVVSVEVSADLRRARVFVSIYGSEEEAARTLEGLQSARGYIQRELGMSMRTRYTPVITFQRDGSIAYAARINRIIGEMKEMGQWASGDEQEDESPD